MAYCKLTFSYTVYFGSQDHSHLCDIVHIAAGVAPIVIGLTIFLIKNLNNIKNYKYNSLNEGYNRV
jgi:hypothetical protein